jgi:two-component system chemotaxis response regulator CheY
MKTVLLVDDSTTMLMSVKAALEIGGWQVEVAHHGKQALARLHQGLKPALIITDIQMPEMDGIEFIRETRKSLRFVPILVLTTESQQPLRDEARRLGASGWLIKPIKGDELLKVVARILRPSG